MLSASGMSYREMGMVSLGFCYAQLGDGLNARKNYEDCLRDYPNNGMADSALRMLDGGGRLAKRAITAGFTGPRTSNCQFQNRPATAASCSTHCYSILN